jgi:hypothetical protein
MPPTEKDKVVLCCPGPVTPVLPNPKTNPNPNPKPSLSPSPNPNLNPNPSPNFNPNPNPYPYPYRSCAVLFFIVFSLLMLSCAVFVLSCPFFSFLLLSSLRFSSLVLFYVVLSDGVLSFLAFCFVVLSCFVFTKFFFPMTTQGQRSI